MPCLVTPWALSLAWLMTFLLSASASLAGWTASGPAVQRRSGGAPQPFREEILVRVGQGEAAHIGCKLRALMRRLVLAEPALHVHAGDGIVHAVLDIPGIGHCGSPSIWSGRKGGVANGVPPAGVQFCGRKRPELGIALVDLGAT